ncbi:hypothetical protein [Cohnella lubricantis]|uniref:PIN domain-containing protein n=1 Tax=Cohnella lubricantis TaxID=2163172 RepID=A0A841T9X1_9BACL|nr:hypothetical protein [Cohnella lubricantis]MBB6678104.1 hypothetical protein [Cohnella lubricantis]MBP2120466.1 hypothetical protein [Cohnella lubricantis]
MSVKKILIIDTSILCCWINVPGKEDCGSENDRWDSERASKKINDEVQRGATLVLPLATIIETGNHIAQSTGDRYATALRLIDIIKKAIQNETPWAAFSDQSVLWDEGEVSRLTEEWPTLAAQGISIGDATIKSVADYYAKIQSYQVEILTGDAGLKSYEPIQLMPPPRRRKG